MLQDGEAVSLSNCEEKAEIEPNRPPVFTPVLDVRSWRRILLALPNRALSCKTCAGTMIER